MDLDHPGPILKCDRSMLSMRRLRPLLQTFHLPLFGKKSPCPGLLFLLPPPPPPPEPSRCAPCFFQSTVVLALEPIPNPSDIPFTSPPSPSCPTKKTPATVTTSPSESFPSSESTMLLCFVDPEPFMPRGFHRVMIEGLRPVSRAILGRQPRLNNDLPIATNTLVPNHQVSFTGIRNVLDDFLREHLRVGFRSI